MPLGKTHNISIRGERERIIELAVLQLVTVWRGRHVYCQNDTRWHLEKRVRASPATMPFVMFALLHKTLPDFSGTARKHAFTA